MVRTSLVAAILGLAVCSGIALRPAFAEDAPAKPAETKTDESKEAEKPKRAAKPARVTGIWAKIKSLTDEQKKQIESIHRKTLAEKRKLDDQEETDVTALLTDDQKKEFDTIKDEQSAKRKEAGAKPKAEEKTDEKPAAEKPAEDKAD